MGGLFKAPSMPEIKFPEPPPPPPTVDAARQAQMERDKMLRRRRGRAAAVLTEEATGEMAPVERGATKLGA